MYKYIKRNYWGNPRSYRIAKILKKISHRYYRVKFVYEYKTQCSMLGDVMCIHMDGIDEYITKGEFLAEVL